MIVAICGIKYTPLQLNGTDMVRLYHQIIELHEFSISKGSVLGPFIICDHTLAR